MVEIDGLSWIEQVQAAPQTCYKKILKILNKRDQIYLLKVKNKDSRTA